MKTLTKENLSLYLFEDAEPVAMNADNIIVGEPPKLIIADCNSSDTVLHEGVTATTDWAGYKYLFDGTTWTPNSNWVAPRVA